MHIGSQVLLTSKNLNFFAKICVVATQTLENNLCIYFYSFSGITQYLKSTTHLEQVKNKTELCQFLLCVIFNAFFRAPTVYALTCKWSAIRIEINNPTKMSQMICHPFHLFVQLQ